MRSIKSIFFTLLKLTIKVYLIQFDIVRSVATYAQVNKQRLDDHIREQGEADEGRREQVNYPQIIEKNFISTINDRCH